MNKRSLRQWDELRFPGEGKSITISQNSSVIRVDDVRLAHILSITPSTQDMNDIRSPAINNIYIEAAGYLALHHFNERSGDVLPFLPERLKNCNVYLTIDIQDSIFSPIQACRHLYQAATIPHSLVTPQPVAIMGDYRSSSSIPLSILSGSYGIPHMNFASTSAMLDNKEQSPTFVRTVPTNAADSRAAVLYYATYWNVTQVAILYVRDGYGSQFASDMVNAGREFPAITFRTFPYEGGNELSIRGAINKVMLSGIRYIFGIVSAETSSFKYVVTEAMNAGILGSTAYSWLFGEGFSALLQASFYYTSLLPSLAEDRIIAQALSGIGIIILSPKANTKFENAMINMGSDNDLIQHFYSSHDNLTTFQDFNFQAVPAFFQYMHYDAVMSLGLALCDSQEEFITKEQMLRQLKATVFHGVSGMVSFDPITGTRTSKGLSFNVMNIDINTTHSTIDLKVNTAATIDLATGDIRIVNAFVYYGGTTVPPLDLPPLEKSLNYIPLSVQVFALLLSLLACLASIGFAAWTIKFRKKNVVRSSQPFFLFMLCTGTFLMAISIVPMTLQEPISLEGLNIACMATPWLFVLGFGTACSSLLCKSLRLNQLFQNSLHMRRQKVTARDVIFPFLVITFLNVVLLLTWSLVAPLQWIRSDLNSSDSFGRPLGSMASCQSSGSISARVIIILLIIINSSFVLFGNYQCYLTRNMPPEFNESFYIGLSMVSISESLLIGFPIAIVIRSPTADLTSRSILVTIMCFALLLPLFVSKLNMKKSSHTRNQNIEAWNQTVRRTPHRRSSNVESVNIPDNHKSGNELPYDSIQTIRARITSKEIISHQNLEMYSSR
jgi:7 transmembrane sweet-taste receptor of 3 GCPR/Receptor family ligand binding region